MKISRCGAMDPTVKNLENVVNELKNVAGLNGSLIIDNHGNVLCHSISQSLDVSLFGPMTNVITNSSKRLLNASIEGEIKRVLVESENGKVLFLHPENFYLVVLMETSANVGLAMLSSKKAVKTITKILKDLNPIKPDEVAVKVDEDEPDSSKIDALNVNAEDAVQDATPDTELLQSVEQDLDIEIEAVEKQDEHETNQQAAQKQVMEKPAPKECVTDGSLQKVKNSELGRATAPAEETNSGTSLPIIKPPISFPKLPEDVEVPEDNEKRSDLILEIYKSIFMAMSIGASKIMGVAPARGLTRRFLPSKQCPKLLNGVDVKSNSTIDFDRIKENAQKVPVKEREKIFIEDFTKIITVITENYGKVMGYNAFRGMVRPEFKIINESYGKAMEELGITDSIHPELINLLE